jgi:hypothetical protein
MSHVIDIGIITLVLAASVGYAAFALGPKALRRGIANGLTELATHSAGIPGLRWFTRRLRAGAAAKLAGGSCGGCDNCGSESAASNPPSATGAGAAGATSGSGTAAEVRIPVAQIGRR